MNGNFCYPYAPSMLRSASPYPLAGGGGGGGGARYGTSYRSSPLPAGGGITPRNRTTVPRDSWVLTDCHFPLDDAVMGRLGRWQCFLPPWGKET